MILIISELNMNLNKLLFDISALDMDTSKRGIGTYVMTLFNNLVKENPDIKSLRFRKNDNLLYRELVFPLGNLSERVLWVANALYLNRFVSKNKISLFHSTHPYTSIYSKKYSTIATVYDLIPLVFYKEILKKKFFNAKASYNYYLSNLKKVDHLISISDCTKNDCVRLLGIDDKKITTIHIAVDDKIFTRKTDNNMLQGIKEKYKLPNKFFIYVGGLDFRKNYKNMFTAFTSIANKIPEHLIMVGAWRTNFNLLNHSKVHYLNFVSVEDLVFLYSLATALIFPSLYEGFGIPVIEAFNCECAVLCSNNSSLAEIAGEAALLVDPYSIDEIAKGIEKLSSDENFRRHLIIKGKARASDFTTEKMVTKTLAVYKNIIEQ